MPPETLKACHVNITMKGIACIKNPWIPMAHYTNMYALIALRSPARHSCTQSQNGVINREASQKTIPISIIITHILFTLETLILISRSKNYKCPSK